jgi:hypothetical protein
MEILSNVNSSKGSLEGVVSLVDGSDGGKMSKFD